jgi:hypothetical protein
MTLNEFGPVLCIIRKKQRELQLRSYRCRKQQRGGFCVSVWCFLVINVCNHGEHNVTPCICFLFSFIAFTGKTDIRKNALFSLKLKRTSTSESYNSSNFLGDVYFIIMVRDRTKGLRQFCYRKTNQKYFWVLIISFGR